MLIHIVMLRASAKTTQQKKEDMQKLKKQLDALPSKIKEIAHYEVGIHIDMSRKNPAVFDLVLTSGFNSVDDLDAYRVHPEHKKVLEYIGEVTSDRAVVDYYQ